MAVASGDEILRFAQDDSGGLMTTTLDPVTLALSV